ncbi:M1 family metallopeptidase [Maribacter sp. 2307ULW6-5]|uniref:M1 family metallopeptidase n=1 Tax=Maribacter sp. 2307ULW6-5 TaxID=3386275 RepID=UPI0039BD6F27
MKPLFLLLALFFLVGGMAQHQEKLNFLTASVHVVPLPTQKQIAGEVSYALRAMEQVDSFFLDAHHMVFKEVVLNGEPVPYRYANGKIVFDVPLETGTTHHLSLAYLATPKQTVYFFGYGDNVLGNEQIWTQGQGKYTSHWLPSFDAMEEKVEFDLSITAPEEATVIANGKLQRREPAATEGHMRWFFDMQRPMSSYLLAFAIGQYAQQGLTSKSGVPLTNYFYPKDSLLVEPTYRHTQEIFDFLETEIGVAYPWQDYKQVPVHDFLYAGMENTGATIFSDSFMVDSTAFMDRNYVNVNAHEMAHQWFGNLVTEKNAEHHWLHEGFATYYAYLAEKSIFGKEHFLWKLWDTARQLKSMDEAGEGESLLDAGASSLTFYEKGAWALTLLRHEMGDTAFKKGMRRYLNTYAHKNATVPQFLREMEQSSGKKLAHFEKLWLQSVQFPYGEALGYLTRESPWIKRAVDLEKNTTSKTVFHTTDLDAFRQAGAPMPFMVHFFETYAHRTAKEVLLRELANGPEKVRQAIVQQLREISPEMRPVLEGMLGRGSYVTQEQLLYTLWSQFEENRSAYLELTQGVVGLPSKNVRLLWLALALVTPNYEDAQKPRFFQELAAYTSPLYHPEIRQTAFGYLMNLGVLQGKPLEELLRATGHHSWQFRKFSRNLVDALWKEDGGRAAIKDIQARLKPGEIPYLNQKSGTE